MAATTLEALEFTSLLTLNGQVIFHSGDSNTTKVIFNNLSGLNFRKERLPSYRGLDDPEKAFSDYLEMMRANYEGDFVMGAAITVVNDRGDVILSSTIGGLRRIQA
jgi:hypothetical protein